MFMSPLLVRRLLARRPLAGRPLAGLALAGLALAGAGCEPAEEGPRPDPTEYLAFQTVRVDSVIPDLCRETDGECAGVHLTLVTFPRAPVPVQDALHKAEAVMMVLDSAAVGLKTPAFDATPAVLEEAGRTLAHQFLEANRRMVADFPETAGRVWELDRTLSVVAATPEFVTLRMEEFVYSGGAHPNTRVLNRTFDALTGEPLGLEDLFVSGFVAPLNEAGERVFRQVRGIDPQADLREEGWSFPETGFSLNTNFAPTREGLAFHFDPYEVNAYAAGPTDLVIPWDEIRGLVDPEGPLAGFVGL